MPKQKRASLMGWGKPPKPRKFWRKAPAKSVFEIIEIKGKKHVRIPTPHGSATVPAREYLTAWEKNSRPWRAANSAIRKATQRMEKAKAHSTH